MADSNTRIIIDVSLNSEDASAKAKDLGNSIKAVKQEQKELKAANEETSVAYQSNALQLRQLQAEQKAYISISQAAEGSNNQLRGQLAILTQQYNALGKEERDNTTAGKALQIQIRGVSDELKVNESAVGDNRRNVGNYKDALGSATGEMANQKQELSALTSVMDRAPIGFKLFGDQVGNVKNQLQNFRQASQEARVAQQEFESAQQIATEATDAANAAMEQATAIGYKFAAGEATAAEAEAARTLATDAATVATAAQTTATEAQTAATAAGTNAAKVFKVALASTGIGAIIILVAALISYLSSFDPLVDKIEQFFAGFKAGFDVIGRVITNFITNIKSVGDLVSKLGSFLAHPIDSFKSLAKEMGDAAIAAYKLKAAQQDLNDELSIQEVRNARAQQMIKKLTLESKNRALSEEQRQAKAKQAQELEEKNFSERDKLVDREIAQSIEAARIKGKLNDTEIKRLQKLGTAYAVNLQNAGKISDEELEAIKKAELAKIQILDESTGRQEKLQNIQDAAADRAAQAAEKRLAKIKAANEKAREAESERLESILRVNENILSARQNEINAINKEIDDKVVKYKKYGATTEQLEKERTARLLQVTKEFNEKDQAQITANQLAIEDLVVAGIKDEGEKKLAQLQLNQQRELAENDAQIAAIKERMAKGEFGLNELLQSSIDRQSAIMQSGTQQRQIILEDNYAVELDRFNQHQVDLAQAQLLNSGTDAEKLLASQTLLDAQYQQQIDQANLIGQDTTLIVAEYEEQKRQIQQQTVDAAFSGFSNFSKAFQSTVKENSTAYKIAGAIQAKVDAAQALRNNILIVQENIKALSSQGKLLFPYNIIAIASTLAAIAGAVASAKTLVAPVALATGGVFQSDGRGAVLPGYSKTDNTNAFLRSGEAVIVSEAAKDPKALAALSAINVAYGGKPLASGYAMATGGIAQGGFVSDIGNGAADSVDVINMIIAAMQAVPPPIVDVRTITTAQQTNKVDVQNANL